QEQQPLVVNIGNGKNKDKKASKPAAKQGKKAPVMRIRSSQNIIENIKHGAIVRNVQYTARRLFPEMFAIEEVKEPIEIRLPEMPKPVADEVVKEKTPAKKAKATENETPLDLGDLQLIETKEKAEEEQHHHEELLKKAKAALMRQKQRKKAAETPQPDLGGLQLIETSSELKTETLPEKPEPKGKRRSQVQTAPEESVESVVLQQVETTNGE
ncbi:MAG: hypothetical protein J6W29_05230, partial [Neisseriaceae bacterium]|nr:hypothetical protein [Neisseriaceae bacterium]